MDGSLNSRRPFTAKDIPDPFFLMDTFLGLLRELALLPVVVAAAAVVVSHLVQRAIEFFLLQPGLIPYNRDLSDNFPLAPILHEELELARQTQLKMMRMKRRTFLGPFDPYFVFGVGFPNAKLAAGFDFFREFS